jgi:hypothetical protein
MNAEDIDPFEFFCVLSLIVVMILVTPFVLLYCIIDYLIDKVRL